MFNKHSDFALNKLDKSAIACQSATGDHVRLTCEDFSSEAEFTLWKNWSDSDYQEIEHIGRSDDECLPLNAQHENLALSAEDVVLVPYIAAEQAEQRQRIQEFFRTRLTETQYRRLCLYYLDGKNEREIAELEGVGQRRISTSLSSGKKIVERFLKKFLADRG